MRDRKPWRRNSRMHIIKVLSYLLNVFENNCYFVRQIVEDYKYWKLYIKNKII